MTFNHPIFLLLAILVLPTYFLISFLIRRQQKISLDQFGSPKTLRYFQSRVSKTATATIYSLALVSMILSMSDPWMQSKDNPSSRTLNAIIVLDVSRTMLAEDGLGGKTRLETSVKAIERLLDTYPDGRFSLIMYTKEATNYGLTNDHEALKLLLHNVVDTYEVRGEGTNHMLGLQKAVQLATENPTVTTIFHITDGGKTSLYADYGPSRDTVMGQLAESKANLIIIGVGGLVPVTIPVYNDKGQLTGYHHYQGSIPLTNLEEQKLKDLASVAGAYYRRLENVNDLVWTSQTRNLDSQPLANEASISLVWLPAAFSLFLFALWLLANRK